MHTCPLRRGLNSRKIAEVSKTTDPAGNCRVSIFSMCGAQSCDDHRSTILSALADAILLFGLQDQLVVVVEGLAIEPDLAERFARHVFHAHDLLDCVEALPQHERAKEAGVLHGLHDDGVDKMPDIEEQAARHRDNEVPLYESGLRRVFCMRPVACEHLECLAHLASERLTQSGLEFHSDFRLFEIE